MFIAAIDTVKVAVTSPSLMDTLVTSDTCEVMVTTAALETTQLVRMVVAVE